MTDSNFPRNPTIHHHRSHSDDPFSVDDLPNDAVSVSSSSSSSSSSLFSSFSEGSDFAINSMQGSSTDPKRAKRTIANRKSAARSKVRKDRYAGVLERQLQTLELESTSRSIQVAKLKGETAVLTTENKQLTLRLHAMEQQAHLIEARDNILRDEIMRLKIKVGEIQAGNGNNARLHRQFSSPRFPTNSFDTAQTQYAQQQQHQQHHIHRHPTSGNTHPRGQLQTQYALLQQQQHDMPHPTSGNTNPCMQLQIQYAQQQEQQHRIPHPNSGNTDPRGQHHTQYAQQQQEQHHRPHPTPSNADPRKQLHAQHAQQQQQLHHMTHQIPGNTDSHGQFRPNFPGSNQRS